MAFLLPTEACCSVAQSCPPLCNPMDCSIPGFPASKYSWSLLKLVSIELVMPSNHLILCCPLLPSVFLSIRVFSSESALHIRWPKYWSFSWNTKFSAFTPLCYLFPTSTLIKYSLIPFPSDSVIYKCCFTDEKIEDRNQSAKFGFTIPNIK